MYSKFRNVPIFEDFSHICPYFLGFRVGKYDLCTSWAETVIPGGPEITEQSIQSIFQDFALINSYFLRFVG